MEKCPICGENLFDIHGEMKCPNCGYLLGREEQDILPLNANEEET